MAVFTLHIGSRHDAAAVIQCVLLILRRITSTVEKRDGRAIGLRRIRRHRCSEITLRVSPSRRTRPIRR